MSRVTGKGFSDLDLANAFTVEGLANAQISVTKIENARIADQPVTWKLGSKGVDYGDPLSPQIEQLRVKYLPELKTGGGTAPGDSLRLLAPLRWKSTKAISRILGHPGYQAAVNVAAESTGFKSFTIDPSFLPDLSGFFGSATTPAFSWPIALNAPGDLSDLLLKSRAAERGFVMLSPATGFNSPSVLADIVTFDSAGHADSYLALRFLRAGVTVPSLPREFSLAWLGRNEPIVLLPLRGRAPDTVLTDFVYELAHNSPIDVAAWQAVRQHSYETQIPPVVLASRGFLDHARLSDFIPSLRTRLQRFAPDSTLDVSRDDLLTFNSEAFKDLNLSRLTTGFVRDFLARRDEFVWDRERDTGAGLLAIARGVEALERDQRNQQAAPPVPPPPARVGWRTILSGSIQTPTLGGGGLSIDLKGVVKSVRDAIAPNNAIPPAPPSDEPVPPTKSESPLPPERYTDVKLFDGNRAMAATNSLFPDGSYTIDVAIRAKRQGLTADRGDQGGIAIKGQTETANIWVVVTDETAQGREPEGKAFTLDRQYARLKLPVQGDSEGSVQFTITPKSVLEPGARGQIGIRLYHKLNLIDHLELDLYIAAGAPWPSDGRPAINVTFKRPADDGGIETPDDASTARALAVSVTRTPGSNLYRFAFVLAKDKSGEPRLTATKTLSETALNDFLSRFRNILLKTVFGASLTNTAMSVGDRDDLLKDLSILGTDIVGKLFDYEAAQGDLFELSKMVREVLPDTSIIQIALTGAAQDFVFPWQILTVKPYTNINQSVAAENLWGYRFLIEVKRLRDGVDRRPVPARTRSPVRVLYGRWQQFFNEATHYSFLKETIDKTGGLIKLEPTVIESRKALIDALWSGGGDLLYVYAHGHAAAPNTPEGHAFNNRIRQQIQAIADNPALALSPDQIKTYQLMLATTQDESISSLSLTNSEVSLNTLTNEVNENDDEIRLHDAPIVFLNTCQSAQLWNAVDGSFVGFFLKRGARAVLGTESTIPIVVADLFGRTVLMEMFGGKSLGGAVKTARETLLTAKNNPLGLCYSIYGTADATLFSKPPAPHGDLV
jgi:hypothetical protein